ncbi:MAG: methyltransferase, partial [Actinobacteria bacterium]|nr:methyltransferase [Actinomycetota bacterium]
MVDHTVIDAASTSPTCGAPATTGTTNPYDRGPDNDVIGQDGMVMAHYFSPSPNVASRRRRVTLELDGRTHELVTDTGVFSADAVDTGTRALIDHAPLPPQGAVVLADIGCGYGPLTLALALRSPAATVWAVDANTRALDLCRTNAEAAGVADRVRFATPEEVPDDLGIDGFWSNPPIRVGKPA